MTETQIDASIVIDLLEKENQELRMQLRLIQAKAIQDEREAKQGGDE